MNKLEPPKTCRAATFVAALILALLLFFGHQETQHMVFIAGLLSATWVSFYGYDYRSPDQILLGRLNVTTWTLWTVGLVVGAMFYEYLKIQGFTLPQRVVMTAIGWTIVCMAVEWIGYNILKIKLKTNYPGLFGLELMHGPNYLKVYYLTAWILFFTLLGIW